MAPPLIAFPLIWFLSVFIYVFSFLTMVSSSPLFLVPLSSPWWGQPGHTVRLVPSLPLLCALSASCTFPSSSPSSPSFTWFLPVTSCLTCLFVCFSPCFFPLSSLLWPAWAYCPAYHFSLFYALSYPLPPSPPSSLPFLPYFISSPLLRVFAQSGFAQRGNTL